MKAEGAEAKGEKLGSKKLAALAVSPVSTFPTLLSVPDLKSEKNETMEGKRKEPLKGMGETDPGSIRSLRGTTTKQESGNADKRVGGGREKGMGTGTKRADKNPTVLTAHPG